MPMENVAVKYSEQSSSRLFLSISAICQARVENVESVAQNPVSRNISAVRESSSALANAENSPSRKDAGMFAANVPNGNPLALASKFFASVKRSSAPRLPPETTHKIATATEFMIFPLRLSQFRLEDKLEAVGLIWTEEEPGVGG